MAMATAAETSAAAFAELFERVKNWGRWGVEDQRGALNLITDAKRARAAALVRDGAAVSLAHPLPVMPGPNNFAPTRRAVLAGGDGVGEGVSSAADMTIVAPHGFAVSHLDALCHVFWNGLMYNGFPAAAMPSRGAEKNAIDVARDGIVSRGVLLDVPRWLDRAYLE